MDRLSIEKAIIKEKYFVGYGGIVKFLKEQNSLTHGYANLIAWKSK